MSSRGKSCPEPPPLKSMWSRNWIRVLAVPAFIATFCAIPVFNARPSVSEIFAALDIFERARIERAHSDFKKIEKAMQVFYVAQHYYPSSVQVLTEPQADGSPALLSESLLLDPWGGPYHIELPMLPTNDPPFIFSQAPPGKNMMIDNWTNVHPAK